MTLLLLLAVLFLTPLIVAGLKRIQGLPTTLVPYLSVLVGISLCLLAGALTTVKFSIGESIVNGLATVGLREIIDQGLKMLGLKEKRFIASADASKDSK